MGLCIRSIGSADVIDVVCCGKAVNHFKPQVHTAVEIVFDPYSQRKAHSHAPVRLPARIQGRTLSLRTQLPQVYFLTPVIRVRIVIEDPRPKSNIGGKAVIQTARYKFKEVEIALNGQLPDIGIEAEVPAQHELVIGVVFVGISRKA